MFRHRMGKFYLPSTSERLPVFFRAARKPISKFQKTILLVFKDDREIRQAPLISPCTHPDHDTLAPYRRTMTRSNDRPMPEHLWRKLGVVSASGVRRANNLNSVEEAVDFRLLAYAARL